MTFEKHLRSVSRAASQRLGILRKSWQIFRDRSLLGRCSRGFVLPVLEFCSAVWCLAVDTHLNLQDRVVSCARFLTGSVFQCDFASSSICGSIVYDVQYMIYKNTCNPMHSHYGALPVPYVPVRVTRNTYIAHRYICAPPRCWTSQYCRTCVPISVSLWNDLADPLFAGVGLPDFKRRANAFCWPKRTLPLCLLLFSLSLLFFYRLVSFGWGLRTDCM